MFKAHHLYSDSPAMIGQIVVLRNYVMVQPYFLCYAIHTYFLENHCSFSTHLRLSPEEYSNTRPPRLRA